MARYFKRISEEILRNKIEELCDEGGSWEGFCPIILPKYSKLEKDYGKVDFDWENYEWTSENVPRLEKFLGFHTLNNGFCFLGGLVGGDWEIPLYLIIYWDGNQLRCYIPNKGNTYNKKTMAAYGNDPDADVEYYYTKVEPLPKNEWPEEIPDFIEPNVEAMLDDIKERIVEK